MAKSINRYIPSTVKYCLPSYVFLRYLRLFFTQWNYKAGKQKVFRVDVFLPWSSPCASWPSGRAHRAGASTATRRCRPPGRRWLPWRRSWRCRWPPSRCWTSPSCASCCPETSAPRASDEQSHKGGVRVQFDG
jgi:hypothetical protein